MELRGTLNPSRPLVVVAVSQEADFLKTDLPVLITGVGKLAANQAVLSLLAPLGANEQPHALLNVGTAGALRRGLSGTHIVGSVFQHDIDGASIEKLTGINPAPVLSLGEGVTLATGDLFIHDQSDKERLAARADLADMEGYAVADAGAALGISVALIKHVSDEADEGALASWIESVEESSRVLGTWLNENSESFSYAEVSKQY